MKRILIADDSPATRALVAAALADSAGLQVESAPSGVEAIKLLTTAEFDLLLADVNMPDINGLELLRFIKTRDHFRHIPVCIISTESAESARRHGLTQGADDYLAKPFTPAQLRQIIDKHLSGEVPVVSGH